MNALHHRSGAWIAIGLVFACAGAAHGGLITSVGSGFFGVGSTTITFDEVALGTHVPFSVGTASFGGLGALTSSGGGSSSPPAPSGDPFLYSTSVANDDTIEIDFGAPQSAVGAYFNTMSDLFTGGTLALEFYDGPSLLGVVNAITSASANFGGFVGGRSDFANITRVVFRETSPGSAISFRLDDVMFIPSPGAAAMLAAASVVSLRRRR